MDQVNEKLRRLKEIDREHRLLGHVAAVLHWDQETYMPDGAVQERADQLSLLSGLMHDRITQPEIGEILSTLGVSFEPDPLPEVPETFGGVDRAFLRELARLYRRSTKIPRRLVTELAKQTALGQHVWVDARKAADFSRFAGQLSVILGLGGQRLSGLRGASLRSLTRRIRAPDEDRRGRGGVHGSECGLKETARPDPRVGKIGGYELSTSGL